MGKSAGAGSPVWFVCQDARRKGHPIYGRHPVTLTGRTKPYRSPRGSALGTRSTKTSREYRCGCGYVGWSNHVDLERMEQKEYDEFKDRWGF